jgi:hypothetical protein
MLFLLVAPGTDQSNCQEPRHRLIHQIVRCSRSPHVLSIPVEHAWASQLSHRELCRTSAWLKIGGRSLRDTPWIILLEDDPV